MGTKSVVVLSFGAVGAVALVWMAAARPASAQVQGLTPAYVRLQAATPGTPQTGHANVTGTVIAGQLRGDGNGVTNLKPSNIQTAGAAAGQAMVYDGSAVQWGWPTASALTLPFWQSANYVGNAFQVSNSATTGSTCSVSGVVYSPYAGSSGVSGYSLATSGSGSGVFGQSHADAGFGGRFIATGSASKGVSASSPAVGVEGLATGTSMNAIGVYAEGYGKGIVAGATATSGSTYGVYGVSSSTDGTGVSGLASAGTGTTYGVYGQSLSASGFAGYFTGKGPEALYVANSGSGRGIHVVTNSDTAVWAQTGSGFAAMDARNSGANGFGIYAEHSALSGATPAIKGATFSTAWDSIGVAGFSQGGTGVVGSGGLTGVWGEGTGDLGVGGKGKSRGLYGEAVTSSGVITRGGDFYSESDYYAIGVDSRAYSPTNYPNDAWCVGVWGHANGNQSTNMMYGVIGYAPQPYGSAVFADGDFSSSGEKYFRIDHPLDPENKYLYHSCAEGPEPLLIYSGNVVTDAQGFAVVTLPPYFSEINRDPRYQLTVIDGGEDFVLAKVTQRVQNNRFVIRTSKPHVEVSWEVKGVRNDPYVRKYPPKVEVPKVGRERGKYQRPELYGKPTSMGTFTRPGGSVQGETRTSRP